MRTPTPVGWPGLVPIVLAAGAGTRLGRPKAVIELEGLTCLERVVESCRGAGLAEPIVVLGEASAAVHARVNLGGIRVVVNPSPDDGQTSSLKAGLAVLPKRAKGFLIWPVDVVLVTAGDVRRLAEAFVARPGGVRIVAPSHQGRRGHPVIVEAALAAEIRALPDGGTARDVMAAHAAEIAYVPFEGAAVVTDMDTREDLELCLRILRERAAAGT